MLNGTFYKVMIAMGLAVFAGWLTGTDSGVFGITFYQIYNLVGQLFLNALMLVVIPLVSASIITGTAKMGSETTVGNLGLRTFGFFILTSSLAVLAGWMISVFMSPGTSSLTSISNQAFLQNFDQQAEEAAFFKIEKILLKLVPSNIFAAATHGEMLGIVVFSLLFGYFMTKIDAQPSSILYQFWQGVLQTMMKITQFIMKALPIGVFALIAKTTSTVGIETLQSLAYFVLAVVLGLMVYICLLLPLLLKFVAGTNPIHHYKAMAPALLTAFSTSSSAATLPVTFECMEKRVGISNRICSFTLPLGSSFNMAGTALYVCMAALFVAKVYGVELSISSQIVIAALSLLTTFGIAGIPSASMIALLVILSTMGLPAEGAGLLFAVERLLDMVRTTVNVFSNSCCTVLVANAKEEQIAFAVE